MPIMEDKFVINIGRQLGSGGKAVGEAVARRLGIGVYDKQLINLAAATKTFTARGWSRRM